jgi:hypothetical protein
MRTTRGQRGDRHASPKSQPRRGGRDSCSGARTRRIHDRCQFHACSKHALVRFGATVLAHPMSDTSYGRDDRGAPFRESELKQSGGGSCGELRLRLSAASARMPPECDESLVAPQLPRVHGRSLR